MAKKTGEWWVLTADQAKQKYEDIKAQNLPFEVPIIDLSKFQDINNFCEAELTRLYKAIIVDGFLYVKNHGCDLEVAKRLRDITPTFYKASAYERKRVQRSRGLMENNGIAFENVIAKLKLDPSIKLDVAAIDCICRDYNIEMVKLNKKLLYWIEISLGLSPGKLLNRVVPYGEGFTCEALCYDNDAEGLGGHYDETVLTILMNDINTGGLSAQFNGVWHNIAPMKDIFIVNFGNMMEHLTAGVVTATWHAARNLQKEGEMRYSWPTFISPRQDLVLKTLPEFVWNKAAHIKKSEETHKEVWPEDNNTFAERMQDLANRDVKNNIGGTGGIWEFNFHRGRYNEALLAYNKSKTK